MVWYWKHLAWYLLILSILVACGSIESQVQLPSGQDPSATVLFIPTETSEPTHIPQQTETPEPTATPSPIPTTTSTSTPVPQAGETRLNPDTGAEEVYTDTGQWVEVVTAELGQVQVNAEGKQEVWVGDEFVTPPLEEAYFDADNLVIEGDLVQYQSDGLNKVWSSEQNEWVFPEEFPYEVGKVVPASLMGGRLEINDYDEAWRVHQEMVLAWLNNVGNNEYLQAVYGKSQITWDDLRVTGEDGSERYVIKLRDASGNELWPMHMFETNTMKVKYWPLNAYIDESENIQEIDASSPVWYVGGPKDWSIEGADWSIRVDSPKELFGVDWARHGFGLLGNRLVWIGVTTGYFDHPLARPSELGGDSGDVLDTNLVSAYLASTIKAYKFYSPLIEFATTIPMNADSYPNWVTIAGITQDNSNETGIYVGGSLFRIPSS